MIDFFAVNDFELQNTSGISSWISKIITNHNCSEGDITYIFCDDAYLHKLNIQFLDHDTLTDIISFDNSLGTQIHGEIYISTERVIENSQIFKTSFLDELHRVMIHGILHFCGLKDKTEEDAKVMRIAEDTALQQRTFL